MKLRRNNNHTINYYGFVVKPGYWYGINTENNDPIVVTGYETYGFTRVYYYTNSHWECGSVLSEDSRFELDESDVAQIIAARKNIGFKDWIETNWDNWYEDNPREAEDDYLKFIFGCPLFVVYYIERNLIWEENGPELLAIHTPTWSTCPLEFMIERGAEGCYMLIEQHDENGYLHGIEIDCIPSVTSAIELAEYYLEHKITLYEYDGEYPCLLYEDVKDTFTLQCDNGHIEIIGHPYYIKDCRNWLVQLGAFTQKVHMNLLYGLFHIFGDINDGRYVILDGEWVHSTPLKTIGAMDVEPDEDGGRVWRSFDNHEVSAVFHLSASV